MCDAPIGRRVVSVFTDSALLNRFAFSSAFFLFFSSSFSDHLIVRLVFSFAIMFPIVLNRFVQVGSQTVDTRIQAII